ncbi:MAG TPA: hypothetical protein VKU19_22585 [Bryobacteraceae bacterium]|nr:hypothetical protein [Bryobacteraceae bacterium]
MSTCEYLCRHFSRMGARVKIQKPETRQTEKVRINISRDEWGEFFDVRCLDGVIPEVLDVRPARRHLVLMVRDGKAKNKFLLGHDERHWFASAVPGAAVRDVQTAMESLRPTEIGGGHAIRQGEWFFLPAPDVQEPRVIHRNEPLRRGAGSKPHLCDELMRYNGVTVMVSAGHPQGITEGEYNQLLERDPRASKLRWDRMTRDAEVYARGRVRHSDHKTIHLPIWHRVYLNRERFAAHASQIAFLD